MKSPFKFLEAYTREDHEVFFGRDDETEALYELINRNRLVIVYGQSGTGKTSLVKCGLASRFDYTDWNPLFIRRKENINTALRTAIGKAAGGEWSYTDAAETTVSYPETIRYIYEETLRPVYLIFDQLEELLIVGTEAEKQQFIATIADIFAANLPCRILFILREEYIAYLYPFESVIPSLFDRRLRVEPMTSKNAYTVVDQSCRRYNIDIEAPEKNIPIILKNISSGRFGVQLPYLQVYLDMLWREDFERTYPDAPPPDTDYPPLEFTTQEIADFGKIEDVLKKYLADQEVQLQAEIEARYPRATGVVGDVLDSFVTDDGTKQELRFTLVGDRIELPPEAPGSLRRLPSALLTEVLQQLENRRLLRSVEEGMYELAHDSLARLIDEDRSEEKRRLNAAKRIITTAYHLHVHSEDFLNRKQLNAVEDFLPALDLAPELARYVEASYADAEAKEREREERLREQLRQTRRFNRVVLASLLIVLALGGYAFVERNASRQNFREARNTLLLFHTTQLANAFDKYENQFRDAAGHYARADYRFARNTYQDALTALEEYRTTADSIESYWQNRELDAAQRDSLRNRIFPVGGNRDSLSRYITMAEEKSLIKQRYDSLLLLGNDQLANQAYLAAVASFRQATELPLDAKLLAQARSRMELSVERLYPQFKAYTRKADIFYRKGADCYWAVHYIDEIGPMIPLLRGRDISEDLRLIDRLKTDIRNDPSADCYI